MAGRKFKDVNSLENRHIVVAGNFTTVSGVAAVTEGNGIDVAWNAAGDYTLSLDDTYPALLSAVFTLQVPDAVATDVFGVNCGDVDMDAGTVDVRVWDTTNDNLADMSDGVVHFALHLRNSSI